MQEKMNDAVIIANESAQSARAAARRSQRSARRAQKAASKQRVQLVTNTVFKDREVLVTEKYAEKCDLAVGLQVARRGGYLGVGCKMEMFERTKW